MKEGFKLKSFCVRVEDLTEQEAADMLDRCVELGAAALEGVKDNTCHKYDFSDYYVISIFNYIGIDEEMDTYITDKLNFYSELLDKNEMLNYLGLYECGGRLLLKEGTASKEAPPDRGRIVGIKMEYNTELELNITEPCKITVKDGWLEIAPTSGES